MWIPLLSSLDPAVLSKYLLSLHLCHTSNTHSLSFSTLLCAPGWSVRAASMGSLSSALVIGRRLEGGWHRVQRLGSPSTLLMGSPSMAHSLERDRQPFPTFSLAARRHAPFYRPFRLWGHKRCCCFCAQASTLSRSLPWPVANVHLSE